MPLHKSLSVDRRWHRAVALGFGVEDKNTREANKFRIVEKQSFLNAVIGSAKNRDDESQ